MSGSDRKLRLLLISSTNVRWMHLEWMCEELNRDRFDVSFLLISLWKRPPHFESYLRERGIPFQRIDCRLRPLDILRTLRTVIRRCRRERIDIVHTHIFFASLMGLVGSFLAGVPVRINTRHHASMNHGNWFYWLDRLKNLVATHIVATCKVLERVLLAEHVPPSKIRRIPLGINLRQFYDVSEEDVRALSRKYNPAQAWPVIGVIARWIEPKGIQYIIPAFKRLLEVYPNAYLVLTYTLGPFNEVLDEQLSTLPADRYVKIEFELNVYALYRTFDIFVHTPIDEEAESFGLTYLEALAAGVPSIFTPAGVAPEVLEDKKNAWVIGFRDSDQIYEGMVKLLGDPALRESLSRAGRSAVDPAFSHVHMVRAIEQLYLESYRERAGGSKKHADLVVRSI
jgi:glycosyltransferase involved in cell wall biosynthesis